MKKVLTLAIVLFLLSTSSVLAQVCCVSDATSGYPYLDYWPDGSVNAWDYGSLKQEWGNDCVACRAPVPKTGQTTSWATGDDGDLEKGVTWPNPRFTDNGDGTVTDNLTGLIWLKDANCFGGRTWSQALSDCNGLEDGECELIDSSNAGDWRLPNRFELESLLDMAYYNPPMPNTVGTGQWSEGDPFNNVKSNEYWSSSKCLFGGDTSFYVALSSGDTSHHFKANPYYVWPVRGGQ